MEQEIINQKIEERKNGNNVYSNIVTALWRWGFENGNDDAVACESLTDVVNFVGKRFRDDACQEPNVTIHVQGKCEDLSDKYIYAHSEVYKTDERNGVCADGDPLSIRYVKLDNGRVLKMRCGKFFRRLVDERCPEFPEPVRVYFVEQLAAMYRAGHAADGRFRLTLDRDFEKIYEVEGFGSCMTGKGNWTFYEESSPDAQAAALWDGDELVARCIVWNATDDDSGKTYRLAERQYGKNDEVKRQLVYLLAEQNKIDGHKEFNSSCSDNRRFVLLNGEKLEDRHLSVRCDADEGDRCSYQDSFRYLNVMEGRAYNYDCGYDYDLATTESYIERDEDDEPDDGEYDGGQRYVAYDGEWYDDDNCVYISYRGEWRHQDDCVYSECEDRDILESDAISLYDNDYCLDDNAVQLRAGESQGKWAYKNDEELVCTTDGRSALRGECIALDEDIYGDERFVPADEGGFVETDAYCTYGSYILEKDAVYLDEVCCDDDARHRDDKDIVRAFIFDPDGMRCGYVDKCNAVEIQGTWYYREH